MSQFEKAYYESADFWEGDMLQDEANLLRFNATELLIPEGVNSLVDIGCGNGVFVNRLIHNKPSLKIFAVDRSNKALESVKANKTQAEIISLPFDNRCFDCVTCLEVLEHLGVPDFKLALTQLARIANKYIIISVPFAEKIEESYTKCPACKSIFSKELHLQNFSEEKFIALFNHLGFENVKVQKMNPVAKYKWHFQYQRFFYPEQLLQWQSPICPLCGYIEEKASKSVLAKNVGSKDRKLISYFSAIPKLVWPKETSYYWIMGLFQRIEK